MMILHLMAVLAQSYPNARDRHGRARRVRTIPVTISTMLSTTSPVTAPPKISVILAAGQPSSCRPTTDRGCKRPFKEPPLTAESGGATRAALLAMRAHRGTGSSNPLPSSPPAEGQQTFGSVRDPYRAARRAEVDVCWGERLQPPFDYCPPALTGTQDRGSHGDGDENHRARPSTASACGMILKVGSV